MSRMRKVHKVRITNTRPISSVLRHWCAEHENRSEICEATGISPSSMSLFIQDKRSLSSKHLDQIARYFGIEGADVNGLKKND